MSLNIDLQKRTRVCRKKLILRSNLYHVYNSFMELNITRLKATGQMLNLQLIRETWRNAKNNSYLYHWKRLFWKRLLGSAYWIIILPHDLLKISHCHKIKWKVQKGCKINKGINKKYNRRKIFKQIFSKFHNIFHVDKVSMFYEVA